MNATIKALIGLAPPVVLYRTITRHHDVPADLEREYPELAGVAAQFAFCDATDLWNER